jgi:hypothetical protein
MVLPSNEIVDQIHLGKTPLWGKHTNKPLQDRVAECLLTALPNQGNDRLYFSLSKIVLTKMS